MRDPSNRWCASLPVKSTRWLIALAAAALLAAACARDAMRQSRPFTPDVEEFVGVYLKNGGDKLTNWVQGQTAPPPEQTLRAFKPIDGLDDGAGGVRAGDPAAGRSALRRSRDGCGSCNTCSIRFPPASPSPRTTSTCAPATTACRPRRRITSAARTRSRVLEDKDGDGIVRVAQGRHHRPEHHDQRADRARWRLGDEPAVSAVLSGQDRRWAARRRPRSAPAGIRARGHALARQQPDVGTRWLALRRPRQHEHGARPRHLVPRPGGLALSPRYRRVRAVRAGRRQSVDAVVRQPGGARSPATTAATAAASTGCTGGRYEKNWPKHGPFNQAALVRLHPEHGPRGLRGAVRDDLGRSTRTESCPGTRGS